jgi:hypothetical protein
MQPGLPFDCLIKKHPMNRLKGILLCTLVILFSCNKSNLSAPALTGTWNWNATYNDGAPGPKNPLTPANSGIVQRLNFTGHEWTLSQNSVIISQGTYSTTVTKNNSGKNINQIRYSRMNQTDSITYYTLNSKTLSFSYDLSGTVGSGSTLYIKQ